MSQFTESTERARSRQQAAGSEQVIAELMARTARVQARAVAQAQQAERASNLLQLASAELERLNEQAEIRARPFCVDDRSVDRTVQAEAQ